MKAVIIVALVLIAASSVNAANAWPASAEDAHAIRQSPNVDEDAVLAELTEHLGKAQLKAEAEGEDEGEVEAELSAHTKQWLQYKAIVELSEWADEVGAPVTYEEALRFRARWNPIKAGENLLKKGEQAVKKGAQTVGKGIEKGASFIADQAKKLYAKYKCPVCKFVVGKALDFVKGKGEKMACDFIAKTACSLAAVPICQEFAPICKTAVCPLINPLLSSGCQKILKIIVDAIQKKLKLDPASICTAVKLC